MLIRLEFLARQDIVVVSINGTCTSMPFYQNTSILYILQKISKQYANCTPKIVEKYENIKDDIRHITYTINADLEIVANTKCGGLFEHILYFTKDFLAYKTIFKGSVTIKCNFSSDVNFKNCEFYGDFIASSVNFQGNVYFNNSMFRSYADLHNSKFEKHICFYGVTFTKMVNFNACYFNEPRSANLINLNISSFDFQKVKDCIESNFNDEQCKIEIKLDSTDQYKIEQKYKLQYAKNIKDSFRTIKDILIIQNNMLDAQEWHKLELYAKEKEIEFELKNLIKSQPKQSISKQIKLQKVKLNKESFKIAFNKIRRKKQTNHNSNMQKHSFFKEMILLPISISICSLLYILYSLIFVNDSKAIIARFIKYQIIKSNRSFRNMLNMTSWVNCILLQVYRNTSDHHTNFVKVFNFTICMVAIYATFNIALITSEEILVDTNLRITLFVISYAILALAMFLFLLVDDNKNNFLQHSSINIFMVFYMLVAVAWIITSNWYRMFFLMFYFSIIFVFYLLFICKINAVILTLRMSIYAVFICVLIFTPQLINPFIGILKIDSSIIDSRLESQMLTINNQDMQILANLSLKQFNTNNENIENPKDIIRNNKNILLNLYKKTISSQQEKYEKILNILENKNLSQETTIKSLHDLRTKGDKIFNTNESVDTISDVVSENFLEHTNNSRDSAHYIVEHKDEAIYILKAITNNNIQNVLKAIYIDGTKNDILKTTNILYGIILLLCIFSLQKTVRKNSIIPS